MPFEVVTNGTPQARFEHREDAELFQRILKRRGVRGCMEPSVQRVGHAVRRDIAEEMADAIRLILTIAAHPEHQSHPINLDPMATRQLRDALARYCPDDPVAKTERPVPEWGTWDGGAEDPVTA